MVVSNLYSLKPGLLGPPGVVGDILGAIIIQDTGRPGGTNARLPNRSALPRVRARGQKDAEKGGERRFRSAAGANHGVVKRSIFLAGGRHTRTIYRFARGLGHSRSRNAMKNMSGAWPNGPARRRKIEPSFIYVPLLSLSLCLAFSVCARIRRVTSIYSIVETCSRDLITWIRTIVRFETYFQVFR